MEIIVIVAIIAVEIIHEYHENLKYDQQAQWLVILHKDWNFAKCDIIR